MKKMKNLIAVTALVGVLGVSNSFAADSAADSNGSKQQYAQTAESWFDSLFNYVTAYLKGDDRDAANKRIIQPNGIRLQNHNETLLRDEE